MDQKRTKTATGAAKAVRKRIQTEYAIEDSYGLYLLDRLEEDHALLVEIQKSLKKQGLVTRDRYGAERPNPLLATLKDTKSRILATLKQLNLDLEPLRDGPGRPGAYENEEDD